MVVTFGPETFGFHAYESPEKNGVLVDQEEGFHMAQPDFRAAPGRRPLPRFLANIGIVVPVLPDDEQVEDSDHEEELSSAASSVDSSVVSDTDSDASAGDCDFSAAWIVAIEAATDMDSDEHLRSLLQLLRQKPNRNHFPPSIPPPSPPLKARNSQRQHPRTIAQQSPAIVMRNSFQALAINDVESDELEEANSDVSVPRVSSASTCVQCRYLKVMIKVNISDMRRRNARILFEQKRWLDATNLFVTAHDQLFEVVVNFCPTCSHYVSLYQHFTPIFQVRHDDWWALASQYADDPSALVSSSHDVAFLTEKLWYAL